MNYFKKILKYALPYKKYAGLNILSNAFYALFGTLAMVSLIPMINVLFGEGEKVTVKPNLSGADSYMKFGIDSFNYFLTQKLEHDGPEGTLLFLIVIIVSLFLLKNFFGYLALYYITFLRNGVVKDLRNDLYNHSLELPLAYYSDQRKGDLMSRILADVNEVQSSTLSFLELIVREPLTILFGLASMFLISPELTLFVLLFIPISGFLISQIGKKLKKQSTKVQEESGVLLSTIEETFGGIRVIKGFVAENAFKKRFSATTRRYFDFSNSLMHRQNLAGPVSEFLGIVTITALLWYGGNLVLVKNTISGGAFIGFMSLAYQILTPAKAMSKASYSVKRGNAAAERVMSVLETTSSITNASNAISNLNFSSDIKFDNVSFKYDKENVLSKVSFEIKKGQTLALVGQSGSGKSTIANLISRFYDVSDGAILIDGIDIRQITKSALRGNMGLVTQESILFNDTIKNNLLIGKENASDEDMIKALKIANAWEFVEKLPLGMETNIGDSGNKLSGGQKQRLSIARAVLKNPPIMILDEATSALDTESEQLVQVALENMMKNRTSIVIAHRLSTIKNADLILVMRNGQIVETGDHDSLMAHDGNYKKLIELQSFQ